jgi:hypothetical protein
MAMPDLNFPVEDEERRVVEATGRPAGDIAEPDIEVVDEPEIVVEGPPSRRRRRVAALVTAAIIVISGAAAVAINISDDGADTIGDSTAGGVYDCRPFGPRLMARAC